MTTRTTTTTRFDRATRHDSTFRKDTHMHHIELRFAAARERQALLRSIRDADRLAFAATRSTRARIGEAIVSLGRRVAGEPHSTPAWTG